jgi:hypothetical protein
MSAFRALCIRHHAYLCSCLVLSPIAWLSSVMGSRIRVPDGIFFPIHTKQQNYWKRARAFINSWIDSMLGLVGEWCCQAHMDFEGATTKCCISVVHRRCPSVSRPTTGKTVLPTAMRWTRNCGERSHSAVVGERSPCVWCLRLPGLLVARAKNVAEISPAQQRRGWRGKPGINVTM